MNETVYVFLETVYLWYICRIYCCIWNSEFATTLFQVYFGHVLPPGQGYIPNAYL
jgi:hypothetical protein